MTTENDRLAQEVMDTVPLVMRAIRKEMRSHREAGLSVPQFRAMLFINRNRDVSLARLAEHLGLTSATTSKMVNDLVLRGLVDRAAVAENRRQIRLNLTAPGAAILAAAQSQTSRHFAAVFSGILPQDRQLIIAAMSSLKAFFE